MTINADKDTIKLGETYKAHVHVNFPLPKYNCNLYLEKKIAGNEAIYTNKLCNGTDGLYTYIPEGVGVKHLYVYLVQIDSSKLVNGKAYNADYTTCIEKTYWVK